jgi:plasmid stabilization system protein ParE
MTYRIAITARAQQDRERAFNWYRENYSDTFACRWFNGITQAMYSLARQPERCPRARESHRFQFELYELHYGSKKNQHRILFRIHDDIVVVLHIRHSAQRDLKEDDFR